MPTQTPDQTREQLLRPLVNKISEWVFFHLVSELRSAGVPQTPRQMPIAVQSALVQAQLGAVQELVRLLGPDPWAADWEYNARVWTIAMVIGGEDIPRAIAEIEESNAGSPFALCGMSAARNLDQQLSAGVSEDQWLATYQGMFAAMARLHGVV